MKKILALLLLISAIPVFSQTKNFIDQPYVETTAKADTLVVPDRIYLRILITEKDSKDKHSVEEQEKKMIAGLKSLGIDTEKDLALEDLSSNFKKYFLRSKDILKSKMYMLKVNDAATAGRVIVKLESLKISNVDIDRLEYSRKEEVSMQMRSKAILKAKKQAELLAEPLGQHAGPALFISDRTQVMGSYDNIMPVQAMRVKTMADGEEAYMPPKVEFKKIRIETEVFARFALQ